MEVIFEKCLIMNLLIGLIFFVTSIITHFFPPKKINQLYGYRTPRSMKNQLNWDAAQQFSTKKMMHGSLVLMGSSFLKTVVNSTETVELWVGVASTIGVVVYVLITTENELKKNETPCQ
jgi:uncharacterized membrane protein